MNAVVMQAELALEAILEEHDALLDKARGFGMRTAAFPRGLMPLREAQGIVAQFDANTKKLKDFLDSLFTTTRHAPDKATKDALTEISGRAEKALRKFEDDLKKAKEALVKHEDLLVGENFQEMFQALRLAVLDLDLTDKADFTAKTQLYLDANPAYAVGVATVSRTEPKEEVYKVRATYKAETDEYVADMWSNKANRWFPAAKKSGHARISAFVKAVVDKFKAVHDLEGETLLGSRRSVEDTSKEVSSYRGEIDGRKRRELVEKGFKEATRRVTDISSAIDRRLRQLRPNGSLVSHQQIRRDDGAVAYTDFSDGNTRVQLATTVRVNSDPVQVLPGAIGHYGLFTGERHRNERMLRMSVPHSSGDQQYIDAAVEKLVAFLTPNPSVTRTLTRKIDVVVAQVQSALPDHPGTNFGSARLIERHVANGVVLNKYRIMANSGSSITNGSFEIEAKTGERFFYVKILPFGTTGYSTRDQPVSHASAAEYIVKQLKLPGLATSAPTPTPTPAPTPTPTPSVGGVTPHIRAVLRALRSNIGYPGTLGADAETEINKVLTGAAPSVTLSVSKIVPVAALPDIAPVAASVQALARKVQDQFKNGTAQVGNVTITQKVMLKYRAQVVNLLLTIPGGASLPGPTDPSADRDGSLAGSVAEYFARGSKGALPARITSFIVDVWVTVSRPMRARLARTTRTAGATTFENLVWISDAGAAFRSVRQEELEEHGHREGYPGTIAAKSGYTVRARDPMTEAAAFAWANNDVNHNDKWDTDALAVPVSRGTVLSTDKVTVTVSARDEKEALRQAKLRIYATGRFPPDADVVVSEFVAKKVSETARTKTFEVTGTRKAVMNGKVDGWLFYGWAPE